MNGPEKNVNKWKLSRNTITLKLLYEEWVISFRDNIYLDLIN